MVTTVSVLATDLVDSTVLRVALGEQRTNELVGELEATTATLVRMRGGTLVKHLGDGTLATFASATDALEAAVAVQQAVERLDRRWSDVDVGLRVGVSTGDVDDSSGDVHGRAVVEAVRLGDAAEAGEVLASATTVRVAEGHLDRELRPREAARLKGLPAPVEHYAVAWSSAELRAERSEALARNRAPTFVGRAEELAALGGLVEAHPRPVVGFVRAEAGMGKSTLLAELADRSREAVLLYGAVDKIDRGALQPWPAALGDLVDSLDDAVLVEVLGEHGPLLARLVPGLAERLGLSHDRLGETQSLPALAAAVAGALGRLALERPVLVVLDDLHWASDESVELLAHVVRSVGDARVCFVLAWRGTDVTDEHPVPRLQRALVREATTASVDLAGLEVDEVLELLPALGRTTAAELRHRTGGNPFFTQELLRNMAEGVAASPSAVSVDDFVRDRVASLGDDVVETLAVGALLGTDFDVEVLHAVAPTDRVLAAVDAAIAAGLVREHEHRPDRVGFVHGIVAESLLAGLSGPRRSRLHLRIAEVLEARAGVDHATLAHHLLAAGSVDAFGRACRHARAAASQAAATFAYDEATELLRRTIEMAEHLGLEGELDTAEVLADLAEIRYADGDVDERRSLGLRALAITEDPDVSVRAAVSVAGFPQAGRPRPEAERALRLALTRLPQSRMAERAELLSVLAYYKAINEGQGQAADLLATEAVDLARRSGSAKGIAEALSSRSFVLTGLPPLEDHADSLAELERVLEDIPDPDEAAQLRRFLLRQRGPVCLRLGDRAGLERDLRALAEDAEANRAWIPAATVSMWRAALALGEGRLDDADHHAQHMVEAGAAEANFVNSFACLLFAIARARGRLHELRALAESTVEANPELVAFRTPLALVRQADGDLAGARAIYAELAADGFATVPDDVTSGMSLPCLVELCRDLGSAADAEQLRRRLDPFAGQLLVLAWGVYSPGAADRYRAMLAHQTGRTAEACSLLDRARALESRVELFALVSETDRVAESIGAPPAPRA